MSGTLFLRLSDHGASWIVRGPDAFRRVERGSLEQAAAHAAGQKVVVLAPAADVLLTEARLPARHTRHLRQAVPFAIEEQLSDDVERLHFALAPKRNADGAQPVAVVARARMQDWLARLNAAGIHAQSLIPETLAVPVEDGTWSLLLDEQGGLLRTGAARGHALDADTVDTLLGIAFAQAGEMKPARLQLFDCRGDAAAQRVREACAAAQVEVSDGACHDGAMALLAQTLARPAANDLLQGEFSRREHLGKLWRPWRTAAILLGIWLVLQLSLGIYHYFTLSRESAQLQAQIEAVYRRAFPEARNIANPRLQMEQHLAQLRGGGGGAFVPLMAKAAPVFRGEGSLEITALRFKDNVLDVDLTVSDFQAIDRLKQALSAKGLRVEIQNASARGGKTEGRLRLQEGS
jgi:general secretion pathway protein L